MCRTIAICCIAVLSALGAQGQEVRLQFTDVPLSEVLAQLHLQHAIEFSFGSEVLSGCEVNIEGVYDSIDEALLALTRPCGLSVEKVKNVYVVYRKKDVVEPSKPAAQQWIRATIMDDESGETLPFTTVQFNRSGLVSDVNGRLVYRSQDSSTHVVVSHVGYERLDTFIAGSGDHQFKLRPITMRLSPIEINTQVLGVNNNNWYTEKPRIVKLNHQVASFQPGSSDNTLFNVLRLQPGILAAGEQTKDFIVQGAYRGHSQILFDGITLFDVSSYNDHIGAVNPLVVKDVEVHKSGFSPQMGDRLGGVVNITGTEGGKDRVHANLRLNNQTLAGLVSMPLHKGAALQMAFRRTYYQLYEPLNLDFLYKDILNHTFTDLNLKYSAGFQKGNSLDISLIGFSDDNTLGYNKEDKGKEYEASSVLRNRQLGGSIRYGKLWARAGITNVSIALSDLETQTDDSWVFRNARLGEKVVRQARTLNAVAERSIKLDHLLPSGKRQSIKFGLAWIHNSTRDSQGYSKILQKELALNRLSLYATDDINVVRGVSVQPGVRWDYLPGGSQSYLQPRLSGSWKLGSRLKLGAAWGVYRQYVSNDVFVDGLGNFNFNWVLYNGLEWEVPKSVHQVVSLHYQRNTLSLEVEAFRKNTENLYRWKGDKATGSLLQYSGTGRAYGVEGTVRRKVEKLEMWATYTLSKAEEQFRKGAPEGTYVRALQDQRHEVKAAAVWQTRSFVWSFNYVYGSGFEIANERWNDRAYSRLDAALLYKTHGKKVKLETGVSVLNVLNRKNIRPNYLTVFLDQSSDIQLATLFTPSIFMNIGF